MAGSSSGRSGGVPPGFRFHPTDEELLHFYLKRKVSFQKFDMEVIREVDLNKIEPWEIQERCKIGWSCGVESWYFFSHKDRKYPTGSRTNRATGAGFWKATGRDKCIRNSCSNKIGMRKTLVFYRGRAPRGQKTDWIMHEYRLQEEDSHHHHSNNDPQPTSTEDGWVVCRLFKKKKNLFKKLVGGPNYGINSGITMMAGGCDDDQLLINNCASTSSCAQSRSLSTSTTQRNNNNVNDATINLQTYVLHPYQHTSSDLHYTGHHQNLNEWDPLVIATSQHHQDSNTTSFSVVNNQINPLSLVRSEMDFWAYRK